MPRPFMPSSNCLKRMMSYKIFQFNLVYKMDQEIKQLLKDIVSRLELLEEEIREIKYCLVPKITNEKKTKPVNRYETDYYTYGC